MGVFAFTDRTRGVLQASGNEAASFGHEYIGTEHLLLALLHDPDSVARAVLTTLGTDLEGIRTQVGAVVKPGRTAVPPETERPYTSRAKRVLELAMLSARDDNHASVGTQHLLLGLLREKNGIGAQVLAHAGVTASRVTAALAAQPWRE